MSTLQKRIRRDNAKKRLQHQLLAGTKTKKGTTDEQVELTEKDIKRINKELEKLK